jgi:hypothetical protein
MVAKNDDRAGSLNPFAAILAEGVIRERPPDPAEGWPDDHEADWDDNGLLADFIQSARSVVLDDRLGNIEDKPSGFGSSGLEDLHVRIGKNLGSE